MEHCKKVKKFYILILILFFLFITHQRSFAYFLTISQKIELLNKGIITDKNGNMYNVRIIPGYKSGYLLLKNNWRRGFRNEKRGLINIGGGLKEIPLSLKHTKYYFSKQPYSNMKKWYVKSYHTEKYLFSKYMGSHLINAWRTYFKLANITYKKRAFGWWFSYPWAIIKGTVNSSLRIATGTIGSIYMVSHPIIIVPFYELSKPLMKISYYSAYGSIKAIYGFGQINYGLGINQVFSGTALPLVSNVWTTSVGVPMGVLGRAPSVKSADDWWVILLPGSPEYSKNKNRMAQKIKKNSPIILQSALKEYRFEKELSLIITKKYEIFKLLEKKKRAINRKYIIKEDSLRKNIFGKEMQTSFKTSSKKLNINEINIITEIITNYLNETQTFKKLDKKEQKDIIQFIVNKYGKILMLSTNENYINPFSKSTPLNILNEEIEEIKKSKQIK